MCASLGDFYFNSRFERVQQCRIRVPCHYFALLQVVDQHYSLKTNQNQLPSSSYTTTRTVLCWARFHCCLDSGTHVYMAVKPRPIGGHKSKRKILRVANGNRQTLRRKFPFECVFWPVASNHAVFRRGCCALVYSAILQCQQVGGRSLRCQTFSSVSFIKVQFNWQPKMRLTFAA